MRSIQLILIALLLASVSCKKKQVELSGNWRAELYLQGDTLPFNFILEDFDSPRLWLLNGNEKISVDDVLLSNDSLNATMHIFDTELRAEISNDRMNGVFEKNYSEGYVLDFSATKGEEYRFSSDPNSEVNISGKWAVLFESAIEDSTLAIGEFRQEGNLVNGTFLTITGDYRFLEGEVDGRDLKLSCFDGEHAFLFEAHLDESNILKGTFKSGKTWNEKWTAYRDDSIQLKNSFQLTYLKEQSDSIYFAFPNMNGDTVKYPSPNFNDKVVLIQVFGTWCPNCMDETKFLAQWYEENKDRGVEILAIAYERKNDLEYAAQRVKKVKEKLGANYQFLFGGSSDKSMASESLPMLNEIISFPTLIFIDKKGRVRNIHTGFSGPGTGKYYDEFIEEFNQVTKKLIEEK